MGKRDVFAQHIATWFGCGHAPLAPGTVASLATLPLHRLLLRLGGGGHLAAVLGAVAIGVWAADRTARLLDSDDPPQVVIDEVAGTLIALGLVSRRGLGAELASIALFRLLDIAKPGPVDRVQKLQPPGVGIMADDVVAGLIAGLAARCLWRR